MPAADVAVPAPGERCAFEGVAPLLAAGGSEATGQEHSPAQPADSRLSAHREPLGADLDRHRGICDPPPPNECAWRVVQLLNEATGEVVWGRCKATNRCPRCQR